MRASRLAILSAVLALVAMAHGQATYRYSVGPANVQSNKDSDYPSVSADGRYIAFESAATNLVPGDTNGKLDVFVRDVLTDTTTRVSVSTAGGQGDANSQEASISADGRFVAFTSYATNLVASDTNAFRDIFVRDMVAGTTTRVSVSSAGVQALGFSEYPAISGNGRYVVFQSSALNLVTPDEGHSDIFLHDNVTGSTTRASTTSGGAQANGASIVPTINSDGRFVAFESYSTNLDVGDNNGKEDIFVRDLLFGETSVASVSSSGAYPDAASFNPSLSADGRYVAFESLGTNLVANDTNAVRDIFVRDRNTSQTTRVSVSTTGQQANAACFGPVISADGRYVIFYSIASNLVQGDTNGGVDVYLHDRNSGETSRISVSSAGSQANGVSNHAAADANFFFVAFSSGASNLITGDTNNMADIFGHFVGTEHFEITGISVAPTSVVGGHISTCTVTLKNAAPSGGAIVTVISSDPSIATAPYTFKVPAGNVSGTFSISTVPVSAQATAQIQAYGFQTMKAALLTVRPPTPASVSTASSVVGGNQITGTILLDGLAGEPQVLVRLTDDSPSLLMSTYCIVPAGSDEGEFNIWTYGVATPTDVTISAYANSVTKTCVVTLLPASLSNFRVNPTAVVGGNPSLGNLSLDGMAPSSGIVVSLSSSDTSAAAMANSTTLPYGSRQKTFPISSFGVDATTNVTLTAVALGVTRTASLQVRPAALLEITLEAGTIKGGTSTISTVGMTGKTGPLGRTVGLSSNSAKVIVPASMYVPPQKPSWTFTVQSQVVTVTTTATITATQGAVTKTVQITLTP